MSNTGYFSNSTNLSNIFLPISQGSVSTTITNYFDKDRELNTLFGSIDSTNAVATTITTNYKVKGKDLNTIFASKYLLPPTSQLTTTYGTNKTGTLVADFAMPSGYNYNYFNFALYGGGGDGSEAGQANYSTGGAGAGAFIRAASIPYTYDSETIQSINYAISGGGVNGQDTSVTITYSSSTSIKLTAGPGVSTRNDGTTTGAAGGKASYTNNTSFYSVGNITLADGPNGGNEGNSGSANTYTSSGSGYSRSTNSPSGNPPTASVTYNHNEVTITINSFGGGQTQKTSGYGAGGAATPANYNPNGGPSEAPDYRKGSPGTIVYWLST